MTILIYAGLGVLILVGYLVVQEITDRWNKP